MNQRVASAICLSFVLACGEKETQRTLPSVQLAMDRAMAATYEDDETQIFEVRRQVPLPVLAPSDEEMNDLSSGDPPQPFERTPWVTIDDLRVQLSYTVTNLDPEPHMVEVLVDPWNEFASYYPGLQVENAEEGVYAPNVSGINSRWLLAGSNEGERSRLHGVYTFDEMEEMARDFATVMNMIENPPAAAAPSEEEGMGELIVYVNHTFANPSTRDVLAQGHIPAIIPALTGFDLGLRTYEAATIAIEVIVEIVDEGSEKLQTDDNRGELLPEPPEVITVGSAPAAG